MVYAKSVDDKLVNNNENIKDSIATTKRNARYSSRVTGISSDASDIIPGRNHTRMPYKSATERCCHCLLNRWGKRSTVCLHACL